MGDQMTYEQARRAIREHFDSEWSAIVPTLYQNEQGSVGDADYWARLTIRPSSASQIAIGAPQFRRLGVVFIQLFAKQDRGMDALAALEQRAVEVFEGQTVEGVRFRNVGSDDIGQDGRGYYQINVTGDFAFDTT